MPRILTVDDSRAIRMIVSKQVLELGFEVEEAEDGNEGLKKLQAGTFDLVLLDVTMPNLDGPGMLMKMREANNRTPVVMLTSESKTSIVTALMKLGIGDYILKPFKADELRAKLLKALRLPADFAAAAKAPHAAAEAPAHGAPAPLPAQGASVSARGKVDILVIDDIENVHKKLRTMIPSTIAVDGCLNVVEGLALARVRAYKLILIDAEIQRPTSRRWRSSSACCSRRPASWGWRSAAPTTWERRCAIWAWMASSRSRSRRRSSTR